MKHFITAIALTLGLSAGIAMARSTTNGSGPDAPTSPCTHEGELCTRTCSAGFHGEIVCFNGYPRCVCVPN